MSLNKALEHYKHEMDRGEVATAFRAILKTLSKLRLAMVEKYPSETYFGHLYVGAMDYSFFAFVPIELKPYKLKIPVLFNHKTTTFEVWLSGVNKRVQSAYIQKLGADERKQYLMATEGQKVEYIVRHVIDVDVDLDNPKKLRSELLERISAFEKDMVSLVNEHAK